MAKPNPNQDAGMAKPELRKHIIMARRKPLHIAFALGGNGRPIIVMHPRTAPRAIEKQIKDEAKDSKNHRFGLLRFDEDEPSIARIVVNKPSTGMAKKLVVALKGTGVRQIELVMEDGSPVESAESEDDEADGAEDGAEGQDDTGDGADASLAASDTDGDQAGMDAEPAGDPAVPDTAGTETAPADAGTAEPEALDAKELTRTLAGLVKRMIAVIGTDPSQKAALVELATDAQASLKRGDLQQAAAGIAVFQQALDPANPPADTDAAAPAPDTAMAPDPATAGTPAHGKAAVQRYRKSRLVWVATRAKVDADLQKLGGVIAGFDMGGRFGDNIAATFLKTVDPVLSTLDDSLAGLLDQAEQAEDQDEADQAMDQARTTIGLYQDFAASNPLIQQLDSNPFMPMAIGKTLNASLAVLAASLR